MFPERQSITAFLAWLRDGRSGFESSDQQYIAAQELIAAIIERDERSVGPVAEWSTLLAPVLCSSDAQQTEFYKIFAKWFGNEPVVDTPPHSPESRKRKVWDVWLYGLAGVALLALVGWQTHKYWLPHAIPWFVVGNFKAAPPIATVTPGRSVSSQPVPPPDSVAVKVEWVNTPIANSTLLFGGLQPMSSGANGYAILKRYPTSVYLQVTADGYMPRVIPFPQGNSVVDLQKEGVLTRPGSGGLWLQRHHARLQWAAMILPSLLLAIWLYQRWRRALELRRWASIVEPRMRRLVSTQNPDPLFRGSDMRKLATALRRRRPEESPDLDVAATVDRTCRQGGFFSPVYAKRSSEPEYLFLGERKTLRDQQARLQDELIRRLGEFDVFFQRFYFQSEPSICSDLRGQVFSLGELAVLHPNNEVWLALEADACVEPISGEPKTWVGHLEQWHERALLSYKIPAVSLGVRVAEPTRRGLESLAGFSQVATEWDPMPSLLRRSPERWVQRVPPPDANTPRLELQLQLYLGDDGFLLLQACAIYPALAWNITLALSAKLVDADRREALLGKLTTLPWFRHGNMPDWMRVRLLRTLEEDEPRVRQVLRDYLEQAVPDISEKQEALDIVPGEPAKATGASALEDHVYLSFASGRRLDRLSVEAPRGWRKFLRDSLSLRIGLAALSMALTWISLGRLLSAIEDRLLRQERTPVVVALPQNPFVAELYTVAEALEKPADADRPANGTDQPDILTYSKLASNVLNVLNPFATALKAIAQPETGNGRLVPGMVVDFNGRLQMIRAVSDGKVLLFQSKLDDWISSGNLKAVYDLSPMAMPKPLDPVTLPADGKSGVSTRPQPPHTILNPPSQPQTPGLGGPSTIIVADDRPGKSVLASVISQPEYKAKVEELSQGAGEFHFGMPWTEVNQYLNPPFGDSGYDALPLAGEYAPAQVRYFWARISTLAGSKHLPEMYLSLVKAFAPCLQPGSQSYVAFLFEDSKLIRVSSRFFNDCNNPSALFQEFVASLGLAIDQNPNAQAVMLTMGSTKITWTLGTEGNLLDIFQAGSPTGKDIFNPAQIPANANAPPVSLATPISPPKP